jgi:UV DNA damage endonuclease
MRINNSFFGFCCLAFPDGAYQGTKFKSTTLSWCKRNSPQDVEDKLVTIYKHNLLELQNVLGYCLQRGIRVYRISSDLFPLGDHPDFSHIYNRILHSSELDRARQCANYFLSLGGKLSTHPGQFVSISSQNPEVVSNSIRALEFHSKFMSDLGLPKSIAAHINIHVSNGSKDPKTTYMIVNDSLNKMSPDLRSRLTFENEDSGCWNVTNLKTYLPNVPIVFDSLHYLCNPDPILSFREAFMDARRTWEKAGQTQVVHHSEGKTAETDRRHSEFVNKIPNEFKNYAVFCEIEAKKKNLAVIGNFPNN